MNHPSDVTMRRAIPVIVVSRMVIRSLLLLTAAVFLSALLVAAALLLSAAAFAQASAPVKSPPPNLPVYDQPVCVSGDVCPLDGYLWAPGYWAWDGDFYWVPGTWVFAPEIGDLWTPGYWSPSDGGYVFHEGYWGKTVGFYGGIDYGFGYTGHGFEGAFWEYRKNANGTTAQWLKYNVAVNHVNGIQHTEFIYNTPVKDAGNRVSYNGGPGGITARATAEEEAAARNQRSGPQLQQIQQAWFAHEDPRQHFSVNHGAPPILETTLPHVAIHPSPGQLPPIERFAIHTGNAELDQKFQKQQDELVAKQEQERKELERVQHDIDLLKINKERVAQTYDPWEMESLRDLHQQQTQEMYHRQLQEMRDLQQRQQQAPKTAN